MSPAREDVSVLGGQLTEAGWPEKLRDDGTSKVAGEIMRGPLVQALSMRFRYDAHIVGYAAPDVEIQTARGPRTASELRLARGAESRIPGGYQMVLLAIDLDGPLHEHTAQLRSLRDKVDGHELREQIAALEATRPAVVVAHDAWWATTRTQILRLRERSRIYAYRTGGGARLIGWLPSSMRIASEADRDAWSIYYLTRCAHLAMTYGFAPDVACSYCECLFRLPLVRRDGVDQEPEVIGDADADDLIWRIDEEIDPARAEAEAERLWPSRMRVRAEARAVGERSGSVRAPGEIATRWGSFSDEERERRIALYRAYLEREDGASPGRGPTQSASSHALLVARSGVIGHGIDPGLVLDLMLAHWNTRCVDEQGRPYPWTVDELRHKVEDTARSTEEDIDYELPETRRAEIDRLLAPHRRRAAASPTAPPPTTTTADSLRAELKRIRRRKRRKHGMDDVHAELIDRVITGTALVTRDDQAEGVDFDEMLFRVVASLAWSLPPETPAAAVREMFVRSLYQTLPGIGAEKALATVEDLFLRGVRDRLREREREQARRHERKQRVLSEFEKRLKKRNDR